MNRKGFRVWLLCACVTMFWCAFTSGSAGQTESPTPVTITSQPVPCLVQLSGSHNLVSTTPVLIPGEVQGSFVLTAERPGYERWKQTVVLAPGIDQTINIDLVPKTRWKAAVRSLFVPGWGQYYAEEKTRSLLWGLAGLTTATVGLVYESRYQGRKDDWQNARDEFDRALEYAEKERLREVVLTQQQRAYDAESDRRLAWGLVAGVWAANFLDALVFFPEENKFAAPMLGTRTIEGGYQATLSLSF